MPDQTAILAQDHGEWIFVVDSDKDKDEPERTWKNIDEAFGGGPGPGSYPVLICRARGAGPLRALGATG